MKFISLGDLTTKLRVNHGFTLVELIVVMSILAILGTMAFISVQGHIKDARDSSRITMLKTIETGLRTRAIPMGSFPFPDNPVTITSSGNIIGHQGYAGKLVMSIIQSSEAKDPLDNTDYTYYTSTDRGEFQLLALGENPVPIAYNFFGNVAYAATPYEDRYPMVVGNELGILLDQYKTPIQKSGTGIDVVTTTGSYMGVKSSKNIIIGTGIVLKDLTPKYLVRSMGGQGNELINSVISDSYGNMYVGGIFMNDGVGVDTNQTKDFAGSPIYGNGVGTYDVFVAKFDSSGNQLWIKTMGGTSAEIIIDMKLDTNNNIYIGGYYRNNNNGALGTNQTKDFAGAPLLGKNSSSLRSIFLAKLNNSGGQEWIKTIGPATLNSFVLDGDQVYIAGNYTNNSLDGSEIKDSIGSPLLGKSSTSSQDGFVTKLDTTGDQKWIRTIGGSTTDSASFVGTNGNGVYVGGFYYNDNSGGGGTNQVKDFTGNILLGKSAVASNNGYALKLDAAGNQEWIKTIGGATSFGKSVVNKLLVGQSGIYVAGTYLNGTSNSEGVTDFKGYPLPGKSGNPSDQGFIAKIDYTGEQLFISSFGGDIGSELRNFDIDGNGNVYILGWYYNNITGTYGVRDFSGSILLGKSSTDSYDGFVAKINNSGNQEWIKSFGGDDTDDTNFIVTSSDGGNIYVGGKFMNDASNSKHVKDFLGNPIYGKSSTVSLEWFLSRLDSTGNQLGIKTFGGIGSDTLYSLSLDSAGSLYIGADYHNDFTNFNNATDFKGFILLGESTVNVLSGKPDTFFQKIYRGDF